MQEAQERIQRDMATKGTARVADVHAILGKPTESVCVSTVALGTVCGTSLRSEFEVIHEKRIGNRCLILSVKPSCN